MKYIILANKILYSYVLLVNRLKAAEVSLTESLKKKIGIFFEPLKISHAYVIHTFLLKFYRLYLENDARQSKHIYSF